MDTLMVGRKLDSLQRCLARVRDKCPATVNALATDPDLQDIMVLNLSRAVQLCVDLALHLLADSGLPPPDTMGQAFEQLAAKCKLDDSLATPLRKAVGFRNLAVHSYSSIDWTVVHAIATRHLDDFTRFARWVEVQQG